MSTTTATAALPDGELREAEQAYRRAMRVLPAQYRREWEDDLLHAYLDNARARLDAAGAGPVRLTPTMADRLDIAKLALRLHFSADPACGKPYIWGEAVRRAVLLALLAQISFAAFALSHLGQAVLTGLARWPDERAERLALLAGLSSSVLTSVLWVLIAWLLLTQRRRGMLWACAAQLAWVFATSGFNATIAGWSANALVAQALEPTVSAVASTVLLGALVLAYHPDAPAVNRRAWMPALAGSIGLGVGMFALLSGLFSTQSGPQSTPGGWVEFATSRCFLLALLASAGSVVWAAHRASRGRAASRQHQAMLALLMTLVWAASAAYSAALLLTHLAVRLTTGHAATLAGDLAVTAISAAATLAFAAHARHMLRRYPTQASTR